MGGRTALRRDAEMERLLDQTFAQITANPTMVAQVNVPWHKGEANGAGPVLASLAQPSPGSRFQNLSGIPAIVQAEDEDAAENARAPDEVPVPRPSTPNPATATKAAVASAVPAKAAEPATALVPAVRPSPRPLVAVADAEPARVASGVPVPKMRPSVNSSLKDSLGEGDVDAPAPQPGKNWTIQIGAYAGRALASAQLASYADKARDVLASATRIIDPVQSSDGHTLYRARFGLFAEREARDVCSRLTQRGQTCFAAVQAR
jgi:D-alanyl-D-alanine carboxypeptidase